MRKFGGSSQKKKQSDAAAVRLDFYLLFVWAILLVVVMSCHGNAFLSQINLKNTQAAATDDKPKAPLGDVESDVVFFDASKRETHHKGSKYKKLFKRLRSSTHKCQV